MTILLLPVPIEAQELEVLREVVDARLDLAQLYVTSNTAMRDLSFTQFRLQGDLIQPLGSTWFELHADGIAQIPWSDVTSGRQDVTRLFVQLDGADRRWFAAVGRMMIEPVNSIRVDGARVGLRLAEGLYLSAFGGLGPHPILNSLDTDFVVGGAAYDYRSKHLAHSGGAAIQVYRGQPDRLFVSERFSYVPSRELALFASVTVDGISAEGLDLTNAYLSTRWSPALALALTLQGSHTHALLPNLWWTDWVEQQRQELGFSIDGPLPVGSRRSTASLTMDLTLTPGVTTYVAGRFDHRHESSSNGGEGRGGLKLQKVGLGYVDLSGTFRRYFDTENIIGSLQGGFDILDGLSIDLGGGLMFLDPYDPLLPKDVLVDLNATLWLELDLLHESLEGARVLGQYQAFLDGEALLQTVFVTVGYRYRS